METPTTVILANLKTKQ